MEETTPQHLVSKQKARGMRSPGTKDASAVVIAYVLCAALFDQVFTSLVIGLLAVMLYQIVYKRNGKVILCLVSMIFSFLAFDYFGASIIRSRVSAQYRLDEDHRLAP